MNDFDAGQQKINITGRVRPFKRRADAIVRRESEPLPVAQNAHLFAGW
jgi:hypothetical protein